MASLRTTIDKLLDELGTRIIYRNIDSGGKAYVQLNLMVVNPNLPQQKQEQIILHELEHIKRKHSKTSFSSPNYLTKLEAEAEHGRIKADITTYIEETPEEYWNIYNFSNHYDIKPEFENYINNHLKNPDKTKKEVGQKLALK
ncbi:ImmA/IrrE family metallo-endopeptidase [Streptococcus gallolyticus]|uniref:ImmA/IrrE family metallo-endopeptidase n=1 Tax=Streptococcus gallolyticus TaxID=315405 RepID=UPI000DA3B627|nr:ImmA/IrrE family metallo-endopeptidase [Streptococcus gallolyticus]MCQ9215106.1 ImmA/IrrE family metallo-endopeptidase [Streptococcus gallolyticus]SQI09257.1 Uncharacterised protein [Streptococcus pasteurianus]